MNISANGFDNHILTMKVIDSVPIGHPVKLTDNFTVADCAAGNSFCGILLSARDGIGAVQMKGAVTLPYTGSAPALGKGSFVADGNGGIKTGDGISLLVLAVDSIKNTVTCIL